MSSKENVLEQNWDITGNFVKKNNFILKVGGFN